MSPVRVQMGWVEGEPTVPDGAVYVDVDSKWACPISFSDVGAQFPSLDIVGIATLIKRDFRVLAERGILQFPNWRFLGGRRGPVEFRYPSREEIVVELAGKDLACWCSPDEPCHADVLLELANA